MTTRERFANVMRFNMPGDRIPMIEWAAWWNVTLKRWFDEGLPAMDHINAQKYFGLDVMKLIKIPLRGPDFPKPAHHGSGIITDMKSYEKVKKDLFSDELLDDMAREALEIKEEHDRGEIIVRLWLDGFFWFPREMLGIENHLFAFSDMPELIHRINEDLSDFLIKGIDRLCCIMTPDMAGFAEDMSFNHGPMLSKALFDEFLLPYYKKVIPHLKKHDIPVLVDSDGDITVMIPWLEQAGIQGVYPLERQAGVDICAIRERYPSFIMMGGYDKMVMSKGEEAIRAEFERILPVMRSGGYIPSVDHQTPPGVSLEDYRIYIKVFKEYSQKAVLE